MRSATVEPMPSFNLDALLVFSKVVECRSVSRAAELLDMPKSTVSRQVNRLETDLGFKLLRKNTHQITVTDLGEKIYTHALNVLAEANEIRTLVEGSRQEPQGLLRVAIPVFVGIDFAARVGALFLQRFPRSRLEIRLVDNEIHPVRDGFDVAFGVGPLQDSTLIARQLFTLKCFLCASPAFLAALEEPLTQPGQLNKLPFVDPGLHGHSRKLVLSRGRRRHELSPFIRAQSNNFQVNKQYLLSGLGVGVMPNQIICAGELEEGTLVPVLPEWTLDPVDVYMLCPFQLSFSSLIGAFYETAEEIILENTEFSQQEGRAYRN